MPNITEHELLIVGNKGQLGQALVARYPNANSVSRSELDITNPEAVKRFNWSGITTIINAAAYTKVDKAETPEGRVAAWNTNAIAAGYLAEVARKNNITIVHISSDYVFDGNQEVHEENEPFSPLSVYGASKAAGDIAVTLNPRHYVLRTSWVIGAGYNFVRTMMDQATKNVSPTIVNDQVGRLTFTGSLVDAVDHLLSQNIKFGVYNVSGSGEPASWADIARIIFTELGRADLNITDISTREYFASMPSIAPRPLHSTLNLAKLKSTGFTPKNWRTDLADYVRRVSS